MGHFFSISISSSRSSSSSSSTSAAIVQRIFKLLQQHVLLLSSSSSSSLSSVFLLLLLLYNAYSISPKSRASKLLQVRSYLETPYSWIVNLYKYLDKLLQQHVHVIKLAQKHHAILPHHFTSLSLCSLLYLISLS